MAAAAEGYRDLDREIGRDIDRDIRQSLGRSFAVPDLKTLIGRVEAAAAQMRCGGRDSIEGTIRWLAAAAALLFMLMTVCVSTIFAPTAGRVEGESVRGLADSLVEAVSLSLATASAVVASSVRVRRDRSGRMRLHRFGTGVALPAGIEVIRAERTSVVPGGCTLLVSDPVDGEPVALIVAPRACVDSGRALSGHHRRELDSVVLYTRAGRGTTLLAGCTECGATSAVALDPIRGLLPG